MYVQTALFAPSRAITCMRASVNKAVHLYDSLIIDAWFSKQSKLLPSPMQDKQILCQARHVHHKALLRTTLFVVYFYEYTLAGKMSTPLLRKKLRRYAMTLFPGKFRRQDDAGKNEQNAEDVKSAKRFA